METSSTPRTDAALLTPRQVARRLKVAEKTLAMWRSRARRRPLPFVKLGDGLVRYRAADVAAFIDSGLQAATP
jgi:predicted DNA-binding transcriptional regulator AlpA